MYHAWRRTGYSTILRRMFGSPRRRTEALVAAVPPQGIDGRIPTIIEVAAETGIGTGREPGTVRAHEREVAA